MDNEQTLNSKLEAIAWGALFIWWGLRWWPLISLPEGTGMIGTGLILLGLNIARSLKGIATRSFTTILGIIAFVWGGTEMAKTVLHVPFQIPVFEILLITMGVYLLACELLRTRRTDFGKLD